jgi:hypothetical protein
MCRQCMKNALWRQIGVRRVESHQTVAFACGSGASPARGRRTTSTRASKLDANFTNFAAARACRPFLLQMVAEATATLAGLLEQVARDVDVFASSLLGGQCGIH